MTGTREKLVELLSEAREKCNSTDCEQCERWKENWCRYGLYADCLIANGVTIASKDDFPDTLTAQAYCNGKAAMRETVIGKLIDAKTVARGADHALIYDFVEMVRELEV